MRCRALLLLLLPALGRAALTGPTITDNNYRLDLSRGVASGSTERVAQGGAGAARAQGAAALPDNPAAVAVRPAYSTGNWDWDGSLGSFTTEGQDFDNNGSRSTAYRGHRVVHGGGLLRLGTWGLGLHALAQQYDVETSSAVRRFEFGEYYLMMGRSHREGRWVWGAGLRIAEFKAMTKATKEVILDLSGSGFAAGVEWNPNLGPWRWGLAHQSSIQDDPKRSLSGGGVAQVDGLIVPKGVDLPSSTTLGVSRSEGRLSWAADLRATGRVKEALGIESFLEQRRQRSGRHATFSPRAGAEYAARPDHLRVRAGMYFEPSRFLGVHGRWHGTAGLEARLIKLNWFGSRYVSFGYALDGAPRYVAHFVSLGIWH